MSEEEIKYERISVSPEMNKVKIQIVKGKGKRNYPSWLKEEGKRKGKNPNDLYFIRLKDLIVWGVSYFPLFIFIGVKDV